MDRLFVYGTLRRGAPAARLLRGRAQFVGEATVRGQLYDSGEYPALVREGRGKVHGELYELENSSALPALDAYEEASGRHPLFRREAVWTTLADGSRRKAWAYVFNRSTHDLTLIPSGSYAPRSTRRAKA